MNEMNKTALESQEKPTLDLTEKIQVLLVDDDGSLLKIAKQCLEMEAPLLVDTSLSVEEALEKLGRGKYDVIISDYQMPVRDGLEFLKEVRAKDNKIPFIMFTGKGREEVAIKALNLGASQYLNKTGETGTVYAELAHSVTELAKTRKAEEKQCESEEKFRTLFDKANDGLVFVDVSGRILDANQKAVEMAGKRKEDIVGRSFLDLGLVSSDNLAVLVEKLRQGAVGKPLEKFEFEIEKENGEKRLIEISSALIQKNGTPAGSLAIVRDITEHKKSEDALKDSETKYRTLVDQSLQGIIVARGPDPHIVFANDAMAKILGYTPEELVTLSPQQVESLVHPEDRQLLFGHFKERLEGKPTQSGYEVRGIRRDGTTVWLELSSRRLDYEGQPALQATFMDVTERKRTEEALRKSEAELRAQFYGSPDLIMILDRNHRYVRINRHHFLSYDVRKLLGSDAIEALPPDQRDLARTKVDQCFATGKIQEFEHTLRNGERIHACVVPMRKGAIVDQVMIISANITERKKAEEALRLSEERYRNLTHELQRFAAAVKASVDGVVISDMEGRIIEVNDAALKLYGADDKKDLIGKNSRELVAPEEREKLIQNMKETAAKGCAGAKEISAVNVKGERIQVESTTTLIRDAEGHSVSFLSIVRDLTDRKSQHRLLEESQQKFAGLFIGNPEATAYVDLDMRVLDVNPRFESLFGYSPDEIRGKYIFDAIVPGNLLEEAKRLKEKAATGYVYHDTFRKRKDGSLISVSVSAAPIRVQDKLIGYVWLYKDISQQKAVEESLKESEERFRALFTGAPEASVYLSPDFRIQDINRRFEQLFGYPLAEIKGKRLDDVIVQKGKEEEAGMLNRKAVGGYVYHDTVRRRKDGSLVPVSISAAPIVINGQLCGTVGTYKDISDLRSAQEKLAVMNEKLRVVGSLTRHDIRNKLSVLTGNTYLMKKKMKDYPEVLGGFEEIEFASAAIVKLLEFARDYERLGVEELTYVALEDSVTKAVSLFMNIDQTKIVNQCHGLIVLADSLLSKLFYNLIDNSLKHGRHVTRIDIKSEEVDGELRLVYEDDGVGITQEAKPKLFTEGYTTGNGSGYGLYMIRKIIEAYGWTIKEKGLPGKGARFVIVIPKLNHQGKENYQRCQPNLSSND